MWGKFEYELNILTEQSKDNFWQTTSNYIVLFPQPKFLLWFILGE